jgi:hypothetical protein
MWNDTIDRWDQVWADVQSYDAATVADSVADAFVGLARQHGALVVVEPTRTSADGRELPPVARWAGGSGERTYADVSSVLSAKLTALFPHWYGRRGWRVGNETFGGCFCHSLPGALSAGPREGAKWVTTELEHMLSALRQWAPHIARVEQCESRAERPMVAHEATLAMIDVMIDSGWLSESWYGFVDDGVRWMLHAATGLSPNERPIADIASHSFSFTSWTGPSDAQKSRFADAVAALLEG